MMAHAPLPCHQACPRGFWGSDFREATVPRGLIRPAPIYAVVIPAAHMAVGFAWHLHTRRVWANLSRAQGIMFTWSLQP